jgi:hypothetical protein
VRNTPSASSISRAVVKSSASSFRSKIGISTLNAPAERNVEVQPRALSAGSALADVSATIFPPPRAPLSSRKLRSAWPCGVHAPPMSTSTPLALSFSSR